MMDESPARGTRPYLLRGLLFAVAAIVVVGVAIYAFTAGGGDDTAPGLIDSHRPAEGELAPDFGLNGARDPSAVIRLSDYKGKPVVLNWYATWCRPCRQEIPDFQAAYESLDGDLVVLGVNLEEDADAAAGMLEEYGAEYPAVLDSNREVADHYRVNQMPTTFFIDADGTLVETWIGYLSGEELQARLQEHFGLTFEP